MNTAEMVGSTLTDLGVRMVFGVVGSGNLQATNAMVARGARFVAARHECGAATMADAYARVSQTTCAVSLHQGCGLTNAVTGITEAAKSRTPLVVLAADTAAGAVGSNFRIDQDALAASVGAVPERVHSAATAVADTARAVRTAREERRTVVLNLPLDVQATEAPPAAVPAVPELSRPAPAEAAVAELAGLLDRAQRPVFLVGRGGRVSGARDSLARLADRTGALLTTSAVAKGLFNGNPWYLDVCGGFASPLTASLVGDADLIVAWGCALSMWTTRHGRLIGAGTRVAQVDTDPSAIGARVPVDCGVVGDVAATARAVAERVEDRPGYRTPELRERIATRNRWRDVPPEEGEGEDGSGGGRIDPRTLSTALDDLLPAERVVAVDSGNFMGYPSMYLSVPDDDGFCFTQAFQSIGLGLATAIGAGLARPDRWPVAALGDGGALMGASELETAARLRLPMVIVVYNDDAYGAEVHHFGPDGHSLDTVRFPPADLAAIGHGYGCASVTVRGPDDLGAVAARIAELRDRPLVIDAKVTRDRASWWLEEAFRGH